MASTEHDIGDRARKQARNIVAWPAVLVGGGSRRITYLGTGAGEIDLIDERDLLLAQVPSEALPSDMADELERLEAELIIVSDRGRSRCGARFPTLNAAVTFRLRFGTVTRTVQTFVDKQRDWGIF